MDTALTVMYRKGAFLLPITHPNGIGKYEVHPSMNNTWVPVVWDAVPGFACCLTTSTGSFTARPSVVSSGCLSLSQGLQRALEDKWVLGVREIQACRRNRDSEKMLVRNTFFDQSCSTWHRNGVLSCTLSVCFLRSSAPRQNQKLRPSLDCLLA